MEYNFLYLPRMECNKDRNEKQKQTNARIIEYRLQGYGNYYFLRRTIKVLLNRLGVTYFFNIYLDDVCLLPIFVPF